MTAPRIDSVRKEIREAVSLLNVLDDQLEDLHVLAYNRPKAAQEAKVRGGSRDYALDTHGDLTARRLYADVTKQLHLTIGELTDKVKDIRSHMTSGGGTTRRDPTADATIDEVIEALDAQQRRRNRGDYQPAPLVDQPQVFSQSEWRKECEALRSAVRKVTEPFLHEHQHCQHPVVDHRGQRPKMKRRYQLNLLTPREREAWRRANQSVSTETDERAS